MNMGDIYGMDVLMGLGIIGLVGGMLSGKCLGGRLFGVLVAWLILMAVWPVALAVMLAVSAFFVGIHGVVTGTPVSDAGHALLAKGFTFGLILVIYGKLVWEEMRSPEIPHGRYVAGPPSTPFTKTRWR